MLDPFPIAPSQTLARLVEPFASYFSLTTLPLHIHEVLCALILYHLVNTRLSPWLTPKLFPQSWAKFDKRTKLNWNVHVVSLVQSLIVNALALWVMWTDEERQEMNWRGRVFGYTGGIGLVQSFALGYFVWDTIVTAQHVDVFGPGMLAHGICAMTVFSLGFRPFVNYYGPTFILYELSSPFLNVHWFCDKLSMTGSNLQFYNGLILMGTFFSCRLIYGSYQSLCVFYDIYRAFVDPALPAKIVWGLAEPRKAAMPGQAYVSAPAGGYKGPVSEIMTYAGDQTIPIWLALSYLSANFVLNTLNWYWFSQMIDAIRKRFDPPFGTKGVKGKEEDVQLGRAVYEDGHHSVEVSGTEVKKTPKKRRA